MPANAGSLAVLSSVDARVHVQVNRKSSPVRSFQCSTLVQLANVKISFQSIIYLKESDKAQNRGNIQKSHPNGNSKRT